MNALDEHGHDVEYNFKDPEHPLQLVFVCAMWLTGFRRAQRLDPVSRQADEGSHVDADYCPRQPCQLLENQRYREEERRDRRLLQHVSQYKEFPTFDCDAHVTEPPWLWERAKDYLTKDEFEALKGSFCFDPESKRLIANGLGYAGPSSLLHGTAGMVNLLSLAGPGVNHNIQHALNVRNLQRTNPITKEQADYLDHKGSYLPEPRLRDMDLQGIDQVMIIPTDFEAYPWIQTAAGARAMCKAYNDWAYEYCQADPERLYFAALLPMQDATFAEQELYRVAAKGCRVGLIRPIDALGNYPIQPKYGRVWRAMEETGVVYGMHPFPCLGVLKPPGYTEQCSGAELIVLTASSSELPHNFLTNVQNFQAEASLWVTLALMSGFLKRYSKIRAAELERVGLAAAVHATAGLWNPE